MHKAFIADRIFTGNAWLKETAIVVNNGDIESILPVQQLPEGIEAYRYPGCFIAPALIDLQIYGAAGRLLAVYPTADNLYKLYNHCLAGGTHHFLPTVATNTYEVFYNCIDAVKEYWEQGGKGVPGLHIEGPWLSKAKRGAHIESLIHSPTLQQAKTLLEYGKGVIKMITLAPEEVDEEIVQLIQSYDIIVSAGHSNATYEVATASFNAGIPAATHLFNAMSPLQHREPGMVGAIMNHSKVKASIIPDGYHVDFAAISIAKKIMGERLFIITDAVTATTEGYYPHELDGDKYVSKGILSGSALTMIKAVKNCVTKAGIPLEEAWRMGSLYPAKVLGAEDRLGRIAEGLPASFVVVTDELQLVR